MQATGIVKGPWGRRLLLLLLVLAAVLAVLWVARARLAAEIARNYFNSHGITSDIEIGALGFSGLSGRFSLGPSDAPELAAESLEVHFDPLSWRPRIVEVRLVNPVVRARMDAQGKVTLPTLQGWLDSLTQSEGESSYISKDLIVSLDGLRALLQTPSGNIDLGGNLRLEKNIPVSGALALKPARLTYQGQTIALETARLDFSTVQSGIKATTSFTGTIEGAQAAARNMRLQLGLSDLKWKSEGRALSFSAPSARLQLSVAEFGGDVALINSTLALQVRNASLLLSGADMDGQADLEWKAGSDLKPAILKRITTPDAALNAALARNLTHLDFTGSARIEKQTGYIRFANTAPLAVLGARGAVLTVPSLSLEGPGNALRGVMRASLAGAGMPAVSVNAQNIVWNSSGIEADTSLAAKFDFAMLRGADVKATGKASWRSGGFAFTATSCAPVSLSAFRPGASSLADKMQGQVCAAGGQPLFLFNNDGWKFTAEARGTSGYFPLANSILENGAGRLFFESGGNGIPTGQINVTAARLTDQAKPARFHPMLGSGRITLKDWIWRGEFAVTDSKKNALGAVTFTHTMANGSGSAHIAAANLDFVPDKFQPEDISPLLTAFRRAEGRVRFDGDVNWTQQGFTSSGKLGMDAFNFQTPLGKAHAVKTDIAFTSLLPPTTAAGQKIAIARVDWTLPFSGVDLGLSFNPATIRIDGVTTGFAEGRIALGAFTVNVADPAHVEGAADVTSISLAQLITASNLSGRVKMEGKVTGRIPFAVTPDGFRVVNGRLAADGPGRLSIDRSLWTQGATTTNSVQDFAYQALENLAFEQMSAELNSVANGRLQIVFHIKGRSDPPTPQTADIPISDLVDGSALQKPIPLPSGTPIDLTLDTSLNFDELLKSYTEAWSKALSSAE